MTFHNLRAVRCALLLLSAAVLSSIASGQVPTVTALPYLLTDQAGVIRVVTTSPVVPVPPAVNSSPIGSLLGGGFGALITDPTASIAAAAATASAQKLLTMTKANDLQNNFAQREQSIQKAEQNIQNNNPDIDGCSDEDFTAVKFNHRLKGRLKARLLAIKSHRLKAADSPVCELPEEQQAEEAEEEVQALNEAGDAAQEAIEAAESAAEAAEAAAEAAEVAAEAALDTIDVLEALLDALALFSG